MIAVFIIALVVAVVWGLLLLRWTGLVGGCVAVLIIGSVLGHPFFHADVMGLPITLDRLLLVLLLGMSVVLWRTGRLEHRRLNRQDVVTLAFVGVVTLSAVTKNATAHGLATLFVFCIMPLSVYWMLRGISISSRALWGVFAGMALFGLYLAATAVFEQQQIAWLVYPKYIMSSKVEAFLGRGRGPFLNPVGNGLYITTGLFALLAFWPRANRYCRVLLALVALVFLAGIACTMTRAVWGAAVLGFVILTVSSVPRRWSVALALAVTMITGGVVAMKWSDLSSFKRDKYVTVSDMAESARLRPILAMIAWNMFLDHPLLGCGYGQYGNESIYYLEDRSTPLPLEKARPYSQHNVVLSLLTETGLLGAGLFLLMIGAWYLTAWRMCTDPSQGIAARQLGLLTIIVLSVYLTVGMLHDMSVVAMANMLLFFLAGMSRSACHVPATFELAQARRNSASHSRLPFLQTGGMP